MSLIERVHERVVVGRRARVLAGHLADLIPSAARVLDVGAGDGQIAHELLRLRPDLSLRAFDISRRAKTCVPVEEFNGAALPVRDQEADIVLLIDCLHHASDPLALLREGCRAASRGVVIKDHLADRWLARPTLAFMDRVGNARHGVPLPCQYWTRKEWQAAIDSLGWLVEEWREEIGLYPWPASELFERGLHLIARIGPSRGAGT